MANEIELGQSHATSESQKKSQWEKIHTSLQLRWPDLKSDELRALPEDEESIKHYVTQRTQASADEVAAVIKQHRSNAPQETSSISESAKQKARAARDAASGLYQRTESQLSQHPGQGALLTFVGGFALGALLTSLLMQSAQEREPTTWEKYGPGNWRRS